MSHISAGEELLLARCVQHSDDAYRELGERFGRPVYGFLYSALGKNVQHARPLFVEAFVEVISQTDLFEENTPILVKIFCQLLPKIRKLPADHLKLVIPEKLEKRIGLLLQPLSRLSWNERVLILLRDQQELLYDEMAQVLSLDEHRVKLRLNEARIHFRNHLGEILNTMKADDHAV